MRPANTSAAGAGFWRWNSPVPYLFGGIAVVLGLIALSLLILVCSHRKSSSNSSHDTEEKPAKPMNPPADDTEPKVVVIMAGDDKPTFLAKPISSIHLNEQV